MKSEIYSPSEDSYLLQETLKKYLVNLINNSKKNNQRELSNRSLANQQKTKFRYKDTEYRNNIHQIKILDMGSGSGIQAKTCKELGFNNILTVDISPEAVKELKQQKFKAINSNLFSKINKKKIFDLIIFNPPYLPQHKYDKKPDTTAGKQGYEIIIEFLRQAKSHLNKQGVILLLFSSLSKPDIILKQAKKLGYELKLLSKQKLFFEELYIYEFRINN